MNNKLLGRDFKFDFDDLLIEPCDISDISSRGEIKVTYPNKMLPLFTAPMDTVVDSKSKEFFIASGINVILPRTESSRDIDKTSENLFIALGIDEFEEMLIKNIKEREIERFILIDIANGHMRRLLDISKKAKSIYGDSLKLMVGNIATPETYRIFSEVGVDFIRIGIGNGGGCLTTVQTGVGYPMASLIKECYDISCTLDRPASIVADGGFRNYSDIIKALGLGADYVMLGSILNKALESSGSTYLANKHVGGWTEPGEMVDQYSPETENLFLHGTKMFKKFRGMSTKEAQMAMGKTNLKTSEGVNRIHPVEYTVSGWGKNFRSYLSSAMSYSNTVNLLEFIGNARFNLISSSSFNRFNK
jgi:IMP dehydrogenase/GMP reductase